MAKAKSTAVPIGHSDRHWEVRDAMHTMLRAAEIVKDKKLLAAVKKEAKSHAQELQQTAATADNLANNLAKMGRISPKQMARLSTR